MKLQMRKHIIVLCNRPNKAHNKIPCELVDYENVKSFTLTPSNLSKMTRMYWSEVNHQAHLPSSA